MASKYAVETVFKAVDAMTAPIKKIENEMNGLKGVSKAVSSKIKGDMKTAERQLNDFGKSCKNAAKNLLAIGAAAVGAGLVLATKQYIEFDSALHSAGAAFSDIDAGAADFEEQLTKVGKAARDVAAVTEFNAKDTADAMATLARAGVDSVNAVALLPGVADLATAAGVGLSEAVGMAVGSLNVLGKMSDDPVVLAENMKVLSDVMAYTADSANMSLTDVANATAQAGNFFNTANNDMYAMSAALTSLAQSGIAGAEAGVHLRNIMTNLSTPKAQKELKALGINAVDSEGNLLNLTDIVGQFDKALDGMGDAEKNAILYNVFGKQNLAAFNALLNTGADALGEYSKRAEESFGAAATKAGAMRMSLANQIEVLKSGLTELGFKFVEAFKTKGSGALQNLINWVQQFDPTTLIAAVVSITDGISRLVSIIWALRAPIIAVVGAMTLYKAVIMGTVIAMKAWQAIQVIIKAAQIGWIALTHGLTAGKAALTAAIAAETAALGGETAATTAATAAQTGFNIAMLANPVTWIVLGIIALIAAIVALAMNWDKVTAAMQKAWQWIKNVAEVIWNVLLGALQKLWEPIANIINAFREGGFVAGIKQIGATILKWLLSPVQKLLGMLSHIPGIGGKIAEFNSGIDDFINSMTYEAQKEDEKEDQGAGVTGYAPVTPAERYSYEQSTTVNESRMTIGLEKGVQAKVSGPAPGITIASASSGSF